MRTVVIYTSGTLGDHLPFIALGQALTARGYRVRMAINQAMHSYAQRAGLEAIALTDIERGPEEARQNAWAWDHWQNPDPELHPKTTPFDVGSYVTQARELIDLCREADLLISTSIRTLGYVVHRAVELPWLTVSMNPFIFWQPVSTEERKVHWERRVKEYESLKNLIAYTLAELGVNKPLPPWSRGWPFARHVILASSPHFSRPDLNQLQPDSSIDMTGFWFYQDPDWQDWQPDELLSGFCERRPLVLSFSSQPLEDPRHTLRLHVQAAAQLNQPLLVQRGWAGFSEEDLLPDANLNEILFADFIPHDWLFSRAACVIQHGGIGSIARALRQGCPLVIEPYGNDQLYNASRVVGLGVGVAIHPFKITVDGLVQILNEKVLTPGYRRRAEEVGAKIQAENGLEMACELIEKYLARLEPTGQHPAVYERFSPPLNPRARRASAGHMLGRQHVNHGSEAPAERTIIPKVLHQTWKDANPPQDLAMFRSSWQAHHPDWAHYLWTDAENREFLRQYYPWFLPIYDSYPEHIMRVDAVRYFILHRHGGVYVDLDYECLRPVEPLLTGRQIVVGLEPPLHLDRHLPVVRPFEQMLSNAFMASVPGHPFWEHVFKHLITYHRVPDPLYATGPFLLTQAYESYPHKEMVNLEPGELLSPVSVEELRNGILEDPAARQRIAQTAYAIHLWYCTWWQKSYAERMDRVGISLLSQGSPLSITSLGHLKEHLEQVSEAKDLPLVSCLMVTKNRAALAQRAVHCYQRQDYPNRELVIVDDSQDDALKQWIEKLHDDQIIYVRLSGEEKTPDGLWKVALEKASGIYIAQWEDGFSDPRRLRTQVVAIRALQADACFLEREQFWWPRSRRLALSHRSVWPGSLVCARAKLPPYPTHHQGDDPMAGQIVAKEQVVLLDFPELYTCMFDEADALATEHWDTPWLAATERYEGDVYDVMIQRLQNYLDLDLSPWIDQVPATALQTSDASLSQQTGSAESHAAIPKILHQTWKDTSLPPDLATLQQTWRTCHPDWAYYFWTDADNRDFLRQHYPWFLPIYDSYPEHIMRVDAVRYFLVHHYGGVYVDLDSECLRPLEPLLAGKQIVFGLEPDAHLDLHFAKERGLKRIVCNAFMASVPGHPFWEHVFKQLIAYHRAPGPLDATGPFLLTRSYESYPGKEAISLEPAELLYPISSEKPRHAPEPGVQTQVAQTAYAIHHWRGGWWREAAARQAQQVKVSLLERGGTVSVAAMFVDRGRTSLHQTADLPRVSCLMVTKDRVALAKRSVRCFQQQVYPNKELVVVDDGEDDSLEQWVGQLHDDQIVFVRLPPGDKALGELRNMATERSTGEYVAQWDDDDLSDPRRLEIQLAAIHALKTDACFLERHQMWWPESRRLALSCRRIWESSFVCAKAKLPPYPSQRQGEDTPVIAQIVAEGRVGVLDFPHLYTYVFHGANTFAAEHWERHWLAATESYEGDMYEIMIQDLQNRLKLDLSPWIDQKPAVSKEGGGDRAHLGNDSLQSPQEGRISPQAPFSGEAGEEATGISQTSITFPEILILTPVKDAVRFLPRFWENLRALTYPHDRISVAFLESDSVDNTYAFIEESLPALQAEFAKVKLFKSDYAYRSALPRWEPRQQLRRRSILAKSRNQLLVRALEDEEWVLWIDVDVAQWPSDVIEQLLAAGKQIVVPNCLSQRTGETFDYNSFKLKPGAENLDWSPYIVDGILQPPKGYGRLYLSDLRQYNCVELDAVGGTMLLICADLHREGLVFPAFGYKFHIETEGLALMAKDMGYSCWGLPNLEILHP